MLTYLIVSIAVYLIVGLGISLRCFQKHGLVGHLVTMVLWPWILVGSLLAGRCGKKQTTVVIPGNQGFQGPQGSQGPQGGVV